MTVNVLWDSRIFGDLFLLNLFISLPVGAIYYLRCLILFHFYLILEFSGFLCGHPLCCLGDLHLNFGVPYFMKNTLESIIWHNGPFSLPLKYFLCFFLLPAFIRLITCRRDYLPIGDPESSWDTFYFPSVDLLSVTRHFFSKFNKAWNFFP